jgi:hypothetical protein
MNLQGFIMFILQDRMLTCFLRWDFSSESNTSYPKYNVYFLSSISNAENAN